MLKTTQMSQGQKLHGHLDTKKGLDKNAIPFDVKSLKDSWGDSFCHTT